MDSINELLRKSDKIIENANTSQKSWIELNAKQLNKELAKILKNVDEKKYSKSEFLKDIQDVFQKYKCNE